MPRRFHGQQFVTRPVAEHAEIHFRQGIVGQHGDHPSRLGRLQRTPGAQYRFRAQRAGGIHGFVDPGLVHA